MRLTALLLAALAAAPADGRIVADSPFARRRCFVEMPYGTVSLINNRYEFPALLNALGLNGNAVEVGVYRGDFSKRFLSGWDAGKLFLVDPWMRQDESVYDDWANSDGHDERLQATLDNVSGFPPERWQVIRDFSVNASRLFPEASLDFVYIDANHAYEYVKEDIEAWWPKVRPGGILAGHDFVPDGNYTEGLFGVRRATSEFVAEHCLQLLATVRGEDYGIPSWYVYKPFSSRASRDTLVRISTAAHNNPV